MNPTNLQQHPIAKFVPPMTDEEFEDLKQSIQKNGFSTEHDIVIHEGMVLDGWSRYLASIELGVRPGTRHFIAPDMGPDPVSFVLMENLPRRHLTAIQRATAVEAAISMMIDGPGEPKNYHDDNSDADNSEAQRTAKVAAIARVSPVTVRRARKAKEAAEEPDKAKAKEGRKKDAHGAAVKRIEAILGDDWLHGTNLSPRDTVKLSHLVEDEMKRVAPFLKSGWKLAAALGHTSVVLVAGHTLRDGIHRAMEQGNKHVAIIEAEKKKWRVTFELEP